MRATGERPSVTDALAGALTIPWICIAVTPYICGGKMPTLTGRRGTAALEHAGCGILAVAFVGAHLLEVELRGAELRVQQRCDEAQFDQNGVHRRHAASRRDG